MKKRRQYLCRITLFFILLLCVMSMTAVCAAAEVVTDTDMKIGDDYVCDGDYMVWKQDGTYFAYNVLTAEFRHIGDSYYPRQISGEYDEDGNKIFSVTEGDRVIWLESDGYYFFNTKTEEMGYLGQSYNGGAVSDNSTVSSDSTKLSGTGNYDSYDFVIDSYDVTINVNEDNTFDIEENIEVYFNEPRHGIYRDIPVVNEIHRADGSVGKNRAKVSNVKTSENCNASMMSDSYRLTLGSENTTVTGTHIYGISYTYDIGADRLKNADEFYFNIIGGNWTSPIGGITFTINMPKDFDASKLGFSAGYEYTVGTDRVKYNVNGNTVTGSYDGIITSGESLTVRLELPDGYFIRPTNPTMGILKAISFILPLIFLALTFVSAFKNDCLNAPQRRIAEAPYPPQGVSSLEAAFWYRGKANSYDVSSLLFYLASKGYLIITPIRYGRKKSFIIEKLREYDGANEYERTFMNELFSKYGANRNSSRINWNKTAVSSEDLKNKFYRTVNKILYAINSRQNINKVYDKKARRAASVVTVYIILTFIITVITPMIDFYGDTLFISIFPIALIALFFVPFILIFLTIIHTVIPNSIKMGAIVCIAAYIVLYFVEKEAFALSPVYMAAYILGMIYSIVMAILKNKLKSKRTEAGQVAYEHINAFIRFIKNASARDIENAISQNPQYYSDVYAYIYVLCPAHKVSKAFYGFRVSMPDWIRDTMYDASTQNSNGYDGFLNFEYLDRMLNDICSDSFSTLNSSPSSSSGGGGDSGGGGGGDSGGGSGGGGGGSW